MSNSNREDWYWGGYPGHLTDQCRYHLCTILPTGWMVSTVGDLPNKEPLGPHPDALFETYVFECDGIDSNLNARVVSWAEVDGQRYNDSRSAERGHYAMCEKYANIDRSQFPVRHDRVVG